MTKGFTSIKRARTWVTQRVPCLLLPSALDAQFGTPYPRSAGFDTDKTYGCRFIVCNAIAL